MNGGWVLSYYINLQRAIDYIEEHLDDKVALDQIAKVAGYSISHFYRVFHAVAGCTIRDYIRKRRLSAAMFDVRSTHRKITDIAYEHGYESHEVFSRAFKSMYGASPSYFRNVSVSVEPPIYEKLNLLAKEKEREMILMEPRIICKEGKTLVGIARKINQEENLKHDLLSKVKNEFMTMLASIEHRVNDVTFYAAYDYDPIDIEKEDDEINYTYYFGVETVGHDSIPKGMVRKTIPQARYAVFTYDVANQTLNGQKLEQSIYDYIDGVWLPNSGLELAETPDYEVIDSKGGILEVYISIK